MADHTSTLSVELFGRIIAHYTHKDRYYHTIDHIGAMINLAHEYSDEILNKTAFYFAIFYHDLIYDTSRTDNEKRRAECTSDDLQKLNIDKSTIDDYASLKCQNGEPVRQIDTFEGKVILYTRTM